MSISLQDLLRKEYLGEACVKVEDWFGGGLARAWDASLEVRRRSPFSP
jgi:hypothetical protein